MENLDRISVNKIINAVGIHLTGRHIEAVLNYDPELIREMAYIIEQADFFIIQDVKSKFIEEGMRAIINKFPERINKKALLLLSLYDMQAIIEENEKNLNEKQKASLRGYMTKGMKLLDRQNFDVASTIMDRKNEFVSGIEVINSAELLNCIRKGKSITSLQSRDLEKDERLKKIDEEIGLIHLFQVIGIYDIQKIMASNEIIGDAIVEHLSSNLIKKYIREYPEAREKLIGVNKIPEDLEQEMKRSKYYKEAVEEAIVADIKYIDIDKMLLTAALRYIEFLEMATDPVTLDSYSEDGKIETQTPEESIKIIRNIIISIMKQISEETKIINIDGQEYSLKDLINDLHRFVGTRYIKKSDTEELKQRLLSGETTLKDIEKEEALLVELTGKEISELIMRSEKNVFFFLENDIINAKMDIFRILYLRKSCSDTLFEYIIQNQLLDSAQICCLFEDGIIKLEQVAKIKDTDLAKTMQLAGRIKEIYMSILNRGNEQEQEEVEIFNRYVRLYKIMMLEGKTEEEMQSNTNDLINSFEEDLSDDVLKGLYQFGLITLDSAIDWGVSPMEMLAENSMRPTDLKELYAKKIIDIESIKNVLLQGNLSYEEKLDLIYSTFDGESEDEYNIREELVQLLHPIEEYREESSENRNNGNKGTSKKSREYVTDPHARWKLTSLIDKDYSRKFLPKGLEVRDGHSVTLLPNHDMIMIEKMYDKRKGKMVNAYKKRTWIVPTGEFYKYIDKIIVNGAINRQFLGELWRDGAIDGIIHSTAWGRKIKEYFNINEENEKYSMEELAEIDRAIDMVNRSRKERE